MNYAILAVVVIILVLLVLANGSLPSYFTKDDQTIFVMFITVIAAIGAFYALRSKS